MDSSRTPNIEAIGTDFLSNRGTYKFASVLALLSLVSLAMSQAVQPTAKKNTVKVSKPLESKAKQQAALPTEEHAHHEQLIRHPQCTTECHAGGLNYSLDEIRRSVMETENMPRNYDEVRMGSRESIMQTFEELLSNAESEEE